MIVGGQLRPDQKYTETELGAALGISRTPIREALRKLQQDGFVRIQSGKGAKIASLSPDDLKKIYPIISVLEALCAQLAVDFITLDDLREMRRLHSEMRGALEANDAYAFLTLNMKFHRIYIERSHNLELCRIIETLRGRIQRFRLMSLCRAGRLRASQRQHQQIIGAFVDHNARLVEGLVRRHVLDGMQAALIVFSNEHHRQHIEKSLELQTIERSLSLNNFSPRERSVVDARSQ
jgi:DNA-binding GntR family transcriptional regulator